MPETTLADALKLVRRKKVSEGLDKFNSALGTVLDAGKMGYAAAQRANWDKPNNYVDELTPERINLLKLIYEQDAAAKIAEAKTNADAMAAADNALQAYWKYLADAAKNRGDVSQEKIKATSDLANHVLTALTDGKNRGQIYDINNPSDSKLRQTIIDANPNDLSEDVGFPSVIGTVYTFGSGTGMTKAALQYYAEQHGYVSPEKVLEDWASKLGKDDPRIQTMVNNLNEDEIQSAKNPDLVEKVQKEQRDQLIKDMRQYGSYNTPEEKAREEELYATWQRVHGYDRDAEATPEAKKDAAKVADITEGTVTGLGHSILDRSPEGLSEAIKEIASRTTYDAGDLTSNELADVILNHPEWQAAMKEHGLDQHGDPREILHNAIRESVKHGHYENMLSDLSTKQSLAARKGDSDKVLDIQHRIDTIEEKDKPYKMYDATIDLPRTRKDTVRSLLPEKPKDTTDAGEDVATNTNGQPAQDGALAPLTAETPAQKFKRMFGRFADDSENDNSTTPDNADEGLTPIEVKDPDAEMIRQVAASRKKVLARRLGMGYQSVPKE